MKAQDLKNSILQLAMEGKITIQDHEDEPASVLLEEIRKEKEKLIKEKKIKRNKNESIIYRNNGHFYEKVGKKGEPVCIDDEIPFEIPDSWEFSRLANIISISSGYILTSNNMNKNGTIPVYGGNGVTGIHDKYNINKKTLIIGRVGFHCGNAHISEKKAWVTDNAFITTFPEKYINFNFLELLITFLNLKKYSSSTAQPVISGKKIYPIIIPIPPLEEQERIVEKIEGLLPYIKKYGEAEEKLTKLNQEFPKQIKKSILQESIQGKITIQDHEDEPVSVLLEEIRKEKEKLIKEKKIKKNKNESIIYKENGSYYEKIGKKIQCIDDEIPFEIPDSWEYIRMDYFVDVRDGTHDTPKYVNEGFPLITSKNLKNGAIDFDNVKYISKEDHENICRRSGVDNGDILFAMIGSVGNPVIVSKSMDFSIKNVALFKPYIIKMNLEYLYYYLIYAQEIMGKKASGAVQKFVSLTYIRNYLIPIPPLKEQQRIVQKIEEVFPLINKMLINDC